ncbi:GNAT domain [Dillenia turbinata]|uniref:GNAT domain n=1 Tax=Dillenia turbinata TaxID=194707 RepID=A0AAN8VX00_9MAGN
MAMKGLRIRSYDEQMDRGGVIELERRCSVGPSDRVFHLFTDTLGDPIARIRNSPLFKMLVAELENELVGVIQGSIKTVTIQKASKDLSKVGYISGLRVSPLHRRKGIGMSLVNHLEQWFIDNQVNFAYMATEIDNEASVKLFVNKLGYMHFRTPAILINPVYQQSCHISTDVKIRKLRTEEAEYLYRNYICSADFFPSDIDKILQNKLSLGTWVAYDCADQSQTLFGQNGQVPNNWAMLSIWNSGKVFKLRIGKVPLSWFLYSKGFGLVDKVFPCFKMPALADFLDPFGFYFVYGLYCDGPQSGRLVQALFRFVHNMAAANSMDECKAIVTEVGGYDTWRLHIPHWKLLSCPEDLWCIKALKPEERNTIQEFTKTQPTSKTTKPLFVDPRDI